MMNESIALRNFSLVVPLWNEGKNVSELVRLIAMSQLHALGMTELILVNNGSTDDTAALVDQMARQYSWVTVLHLSENHNYGGGVYEGCRRAKADVVCYIPGDLQVLPEDVLKVHRMFCDASKSGAKVFSKGYRTIRHDPMQTQIVSWIYTFLANSILRLDIKDVNGLPKMFSLDLLDLVPAERMKTFVFDAQLLSLARFHEWSIEEVPVTFHSRREGVSSWSRKRFQVYIQVFKQMLRLRKLVRQPGVPLERL
jgi:glycosyltransferase involved in cell wall biosynthesis